VIFVERESQKKIVIGHGAQRFEADRMRARREMENFWAPVSPSLFVKVEADWARTRSSA